MPRPREIDGSKFIKIRVSSKFYNFIKEFSNNLGLPISEVCRSALIMSFEALFLGKLKNVDKEFREKYKHLFEKREESGR
jgi:hypothetical protein